MVKTPRTRHSKTQRDPLTIDLEAEAVSRDDSVPEEAAAVGGAPAEPDEQPGGGSPFSREPETEAVPDVAGTTAPDAEEAAVRERAEASAEEPYAYGFDAGENANARPTHRPAPDEAAPQVQPASTRPEPKRSNLATTIAAGLVGGVVALAGAGILQYAGVIGSPGPASEAPANDGMEAEIASLRADMAALREGANAAPEGEGLAQSVDQLRTEIAALQEAQQAAGSGDAAGLQALEGRLGELEANVAGLGQGQAGGASEAELAAINERLAGLEALVNAANEAGTAAEGRLGAIEQTLADLSARVDAQAEQPKVALAIAASALKSAVERGAPFEAEIATFAAIAPQTPELPALQGYAEEGVASQAELVAEAEEAVEAIIAAERPANDNAGFFERLMDSAGSVVSVRPVGPVEGESVPAIAARMEAAVKAGDLATAINEFETLPEPAKAAGAAYADKLRARLEVEQLLDRAIAAAMQAA